MPVTIDGLRLWQAAESTSETATNLEVTSAPSQADTEAILVGLEAQESMTLSGVATGIRLAGESRYPSDPEAALSQWIQAFETLVSPEQGDGWTLTDDERNRTLTVTATTGAWTIAEGAPYEARWTLDVRRGQGVFDVAAREPTTASPNATATLDGTSLGSIMEMRTTRSMDVGVSPIAYASPGESVVEPRSGVVNEVTMSGRVAGTESEIRSFDDTMRSKSGNNQALTYQTGFPGTEHIVMIANYDSTYEAGSPATLRYGLTLVEGEAL